MRIAVRSLALVSSMSFILALGSVSLTAQEPKQKETAKDAAPATPVARKNDPSRRVPPYFAQIGLRPEQRDDIYKIRAKHIQKIADLETKISAIRAEMLSECEGMLDPTQKQALESRRKSAVSGDTVPVPKK